ncbi:MAG TPA: hypothetical protein EYQ00_09410 [Dehalococcoidia bacterium]|nr:hypothetical protein [Dehalococcoidia bacterium]
MTQFFLGACLVSCGGFIGWHLRPFLFSFIAELDCICGSGNKYKECCMEKDLHESFFETDDEV